MEKLVHVWEEEQTFSVYEEMEDGHDNTYNFYKPIDATLLDRYNAAAKEMNEASNALKAAWWKA